MTVEEFHRQRYGGQGGEVKDDEVKGGEVKEGEVGDGENGEEEEESEESLKAAREWDEFKDGVCVCVCVCVCDECFNPLLPPSQLHRKQTRLGKQGKHGLNDVFLTEITKLYCL